MEPLISIVVPAYKMEPYVRKCLDSLINQTYQNLEIILVDDGSPDRCGEIFDEYAAQDQRVKVIHKENGGLSSARNAALEIATGEFVGFVDSDDWVEPDMFEYLLSGIQRHDADVAVCGMIFVYPGRQKDVGWHEELVLGQEQMAKALLEPGPLENYACDKLWRRKLFQGIQFPLGRSYEDIATTYRLLERADKIVCLPQCKYYYLQRAEGITHNETLKNVADRYKGRKEQYLAWKDKYPQFEELLELRAAYPAVDAVRGYWSYQPELRKQYRQELKEMTDFIRQHPASASSVMQRRGYGAAGKLKFKLAQYPYWWSFLLTRFVDWIYKMLHR